MDFYGLVLHYDCDLKQRKTAMRQITLFLLIGIFSLNAQALQRETDSYKVIEKTVMEKAKKYGNKNVLVVLDIDNTTLAMPQDFGSDQWFGWQYSHCIGKKKPADFCVSNDFDKLLDIQGKIFAMSGMIPTEKITPTVIKGFQDKGIKLILLTSRGPVFRNATERVLAENGIDIRKSAIGNADGFPSTFIPYTLKEPTKYGLTKEDLKKMGNKKARPVSYMNGIFMTSGLNKGIMLKTLLHKTGESFKAIIFADDHKKHTVRMNEIMGAVKGVDLVTFRYSKIDPQVKAFHEGKKKESIKAWNTFKSASEAIFK